MKIVIAGLALIGAASDDNIKFLIEQLSDESPEIRLYAYNALCGLVRGFLNFNYQAASEVRRQQINAITEWCENNKKKYQ